MDNQKHAAFDNEHAVDDRQGVYEAPMLVRLSQQETESGLVILPIEILSVQGPS